MPRKKLSVRDKQVIDIISINLQSILEQKGLQQKDLADITGIPKSTINDYVKGNTLAPPGNIEIMANALGVEKSDIDTTFRSKQDSMIMLPVYEKIACGGGSVVMESPVQYEMTPTEWVNGAEHFYLRAKGDSMIGARIQDGDLLLIRSQQVVNNGEIAVVSVEDEATLKRVYYEGDKVILQSENPNIPPRICDHDSIRIIGKLKKVIITTF